MRYVRLGIVDIYDHKPIEYAYGLCIADTIAGYEAAIEWIENHDNERACRIHSDGTVTIKLDKNEFIENIALIRKQLFTRSAKTGLSVVGEYMRSLVKKCLDRDEILGASTRHFQVPMRMIKQEYSKLTTGTFPVVKYPDMMVWPHALINGPYPLPIDVIKEAITRKLNTAKYTLSSGEAPGCPGYVFELQDGMWLSSYVESTNGDVQWPYGIEPIDYVGAINSNGKYKCKESFSVAIKWDPEFVEGELSMDEALNVWLRDRLDILVEVRAEMAKKMSLMSLKHRLIRNICVQAQVDGKNCTVFTGETARAKRTRIESEYGGHMELLDIPISELGMDVVFSNSNETVPESARDLLLQQLITCVF